MQQETQMSVNRVSEPSEQINLPLFEMKDQKKLTTIHISPTLPAEIFPDASPKRIPSQPPVKIAEKIPFREKSPSPKP